MEKAVGVLAKRGAVEILVELTEPMRYVDLKNKTRLPHATLTRRLNELLECEWIEQKAQMDESGRYYLAYDIAGGEEKRRIVRAGKKMYEREEALKNAYIDAIESLSDLSEGQKEIAEEEFVKSFEAISLLITRTYLKAVALARASSI